ncbi:MAG: nucleotide exchange factor GrpE [Bacteroidales bacterium]|nr:nucleotide exchange factor GrpE [Bacteroidales bacterium]
MEKNEHIEPEKDSQNETAETQTQQSEPKVEQEKTSTENKEVNNRRARKRRAEQRAEALNEKVEQMGMKLAEMNDKYMRIYSEYENYRKRTALEKTNLILNGGKDVIKLMLPVIDDMERALANLADDDTAKEGMQLILKNMLNALQQKGLKPMEAKGEKFDENFHEAITQIPAPTPEAKGTVIDVVKKGYFLNDEVIRFAQVVVAN